MIVDDHARRPGRCRHRRLAVGLAAAFAVLGIARAQAAPATAVRAAAIEMASPAMRTVAAWVIASTDARGLPFAIVDKAQARVVVFDADGSPRASAPALLGLARGDRSVPGIGDRPLAAILPTERTTPAGRFDAAIGTNAAGHRILWVDYDDAISLHAVVTSNPREHRLQRLATPSVADNRISYGCINVPAAFFTDTVEPVFRAHGGVVYVLPEVRSIEAVFVIAGPGPVNGPPKLP